MTRNSDTVAAVATPPGRGGIAVIRMSGPDAFSILGNCWEGGPVTAFKSHTAHLGWITDSSGNDIDQVVATLFKAPHSYTGEDVVELSCHGSPWIQREIVGRLIECGATAAPGGEFTRRAFMNGRLDLAQAEGVADMIAASSKAAARLAASQLKGDFSKCLDKLRSRLVELGTLVELELDFSEEDVEFADRDKLTALTEEMLETVERLARSYQAGNAFKSGIPVAIAGIPNVGKSTLLNTLVGEEKAIVSDIPGTTRDVIDDTVEFGGLLFRLYDTAGLRETDDTVESIGVERARSKMSEAFILLELIDPFQPVALQHEILENTPLPEGIRCVRVITKADRNDGKEGLESAALEIPTVRVSALTGEGIEELKNLLVEMATGEFNPESELIVTNARHYEALRNAAEALKRLKEGLAEGLSSDFLAQDLREATYHIGSITGAVSNDELLHNIFSNYCIGK